MLVAIASILCMLLFSGLPTVDAQEPPSISVLQQLYRADEGKPVTIYVSFNSTTNVRNVSWTRNGSSIIPGQNGYKIFTADSPDLIIYNSTSFHAGIYVFTATNTAGSRESPPITLLVTAVPGVTVSPKPVTGFVGKNVIIYCNITQVESISGITIAWYRNSIAISKGGTYAWLDTTSPDLMISNLDALQHQGTYRCNATSSAGTGYDETTLIVYDRPTVSAPTTSITGTAGSSITIQATVNGYFITLIMWSFNGTNLTNNGRFSWTNQNDTGPVDLMIKNIAVSDAGTYLCTVRNVAGANELAIRLTVIEPPTILVLQQMYHADEGKPATIYVSFISTTNVRNVSWTRNGSSIIPGQNGYKIFTADSPDLIIYNTTISHAGIYVFTATNTAGSSQSPPITLLVTAVPVVTVSPKPVTGFVGKNVIIYCIITQVTSISSITIAWYYNGIVISKGGTYTWSDTTSPDLNISNLDAIQHRGTYRCNATSSAGTGYDETTLSVIDRPTLIAPATSIIGDSGTNITLYASLTGSHVTVVIWSFNGTSLTNDGDNGRFSWTNRNSTGPVDLTIRNLAQSDTGTYVCTVRNAAGANELTIRLTVNVQTGASTDEKPSLSQAAIAAIAIGVLFFIQLVILIIFVIYCCTHGACRKDDTKTKVAPSEKKADVLHQPILHASKKISVQGPRLGIPVFMEKSSVEDLSHGSVTSAVSRKHVDVEERESNYGFEDKPMHTQLPYRKQSNDEGPIISLLIDEVAFPIMTYGSAARCDYQEPIDCKSSPPDQDTVYLHEGKNVKKKKRKRNTGRHHHHRHHRGTEQFGNEEPYPGVLPAIPS